MRLEEKKLDQLTLKLKQLTQQINACQHQIDRIRERRSAAISQPNFSGSIVQLTQLVSFSDSIRTRIEQLNEGYTALTDQRQAVLDEVSAQRTKIKGWSILVEKLKREDASAVERISMLEADDRALSNFASNRKIK